MYTIALKMLFGDRAKYFMIVSALIFTTILMTEQSAIFCGLMRWSTAPLRNVQVPIWVVDPQVEQVNEVSPMRDIDLYRVRSVKGVDWAVPLYQSNQQARLPNAHFKSVVLLGVDTATLIGIPPIILQGKLEDLWKAESIFIDELGLQRLNLGLSRPLGIGDTFEINDHEVRIVGIVKAEPTFQGAPYVYTTYDKAVEIAPPIRKNLGFILVKPLDGFDIRQVINNIHKETGLRAYTSNEFFWATIKWYFQNTSIPISFGTTIILGFLVGIAVSGQTFYMFVLENLRHLGALKAMGASDGLLFRMLTLQAAVVGILGYGIGIGLASLFGYFAIQAQHFPFFLPWQIPVLVFVSIVAICTMSAMIGIHKVSKFELSEVFRD